MVSGESLSVVVVGGGPRGTSVLERLLARLLALPAAARPRLSITVLEPEEPGAGHIWRTAQPRLFLMNTPALYPTVVPAGATAAQLPGSPVRLSFDGWRQGCAAGTVAEPGLDAQDRAELAGLSSTGFPSRALYGRYLTWSYRQVAAALGAVAELAHRATTAERITRRAAGYLIVLADGGTLPADAVVLALGHLPARLNAEQDALARAAPGLGLHYQGPNIPGDVDWSTLPAGENVLIRGLGLNFFDVAIALTQGRGGSFTATGADPGRALSYLPSGREPKIFAASRRGTPYRAKAETAGLPAPVRLRYLTPAAVDRLRGGPGGLSFDHDLWPLLHRDVLWTYYATLARVCPRLFDAGAQEFLHRLEATLAEPQRPGQEVWQRRVQELLSAAAPRVHWLDVEGLGHPFAHRGFESAAEYQQAVLEYLQADAAGSAQGGDNPLKTAIGTLNAGRALVKALAADGALSEASWLQELRGWFEPLVEGLASGPPALRIEQLAALARAGVVQFIGPDPEFRLDAGAGAFTAASPWVAGMHVRAGALVEAMMPANRVQLTRSPVLKALLADGLGRPRVMVNAEGAEVLGQGLDVTRAPHRLIGRDGVPAEDLFALGLQLSSVQWGTAIAAEAGADIAAGARTLADADAIAAAVLNLTGLRR